MSENENLPIVRIEINSGTFTIPAADKIYEITVRQSPKFSEALDTIVLNELGVERTDSRSASVDRQQPTASPEDELQRIALYKEISEDMFKEIGRLARDLSISIKDLPSCFQKEINIEKAGLDLESAKGMLEEVVKMTETATMTIMDISEEMQEQCAIISKNLEDVRTLNFVGNTVAGSDSIEKKDPMILIREMLLTLCTLRDALIALPEHVLYGDQPVSAVLAQLESQIGILDQEYNRLLQSSDRYMVVNDSYSMVKKEDHDRLICALESSDQVIQCIIGSIGRILESLSFQDLSGQRIIKIVDLLSNVQIQLLSILVSSGVKLKRLREGRSIEKSSAEAEVNELMNRFRSDSQKDGKSKNILDQSAIDSLLADLGF